MQHAAGSMNTCARIVLCDGVPGSITVTCEPLLILKCYCKLAVRGGSLPLVTLHMQGALALYNGFGISVLGIIPYRGTYFGLYDTAREKNPFKVSMYTQ
jgi:Mitochondrial carrier protein